MANTFITPQWVTNDVATNFNNELKLINQFDREWDDSFKNYPGGAKIGYTVSARLPQRFTVTEGQAYQQQAIYNQTVPITVNHQFNVGMGWSTADATMDVQDVQSRYTVPAGMAMANKWDVVAGAEVYKSVYFVAGTPGTAITSNQTYTDAVAQLITFGVPDEFIAVIDPKSQSNLLNANFALFHPTAQIAEYFRRGQFAAEALGVDEWYTDPVLPVHTTGTFTSSTPVVSGANQTGSTLSVSGLGTYAFKAGDIFTIAGLNGVNPLAYSDTGILQQFVITADTSGSSTATLPISPSIITSGSLQTVMASPTNGAALSFLGATGTVNATMAATSTRQSLLFHPSAFAFVMADMDSDLPGAVVKMARSKQAKLSMRWVGQYNGQTDQKLSRVDTIGGVAPILPYFALRLFS